LQLIAQLQTRYLYTTKKQLTKLHLCTRKTHKKIIRNLNAAQQNAFSNLAATYMQSAKQFVINKLAQSTILKS